MRYAGKVNAQAIECGFRVAKPGVTLARVNAIIERYILNAGCVPAFKNYQPPGMATPFPAAACISPNDVVVHGIPDDYIIQAGDLITIDVGTEYEGWFADSARSRVMGAPQCDRSQNLVDATEAIMSAQLAYVRDGCTFMRLVEAAERTADEKGVVLIHQFGGHYIGDQVHVDPFIPNAINRTQSALKQHLDVTRYTRQTLKTGETICIEPVTAYDNADIMIDKDGWTVRKRNGDIVAHTERCIVVLDDGYELLS